MSEEDKLPSLQDLDKSIKEAKKKAEGVAKKTDSNDGSKFAVELFAGVVVGLFIGYQIDSYFDTFPLFFIICLLLGMAGSFLNIYRAVQQNNKDDN
jgi:F0F1-type ATP synthase assembly protein I